MSGDLCGLRSIFIYSRRCVSWRASFQRRRAQRRMAHSARKEGATAPSVASVFLHLGQLLAWLRLC